MGPAAAETVVRLLHFADTHIGVETYGRVDPTTGRNTRLADFEAALRQAVRVGLDQQVDAALFAGDAYRHCNPSPTHQQVFAGAVRELVEAGIPLVLVAGNHDLPVAFGRASALDIFRTLGGGLVHVATRPEVYRVETRSGPLQVACLPWPTRSLLLTDETPRDLSDESVRREMEDICRRCLDDLATQLDPLVPGILLAHLTAAEAQFSGSEKAGLVGADPALPAAALGDPRFDYVALGHIHKHQELNSGRRPPVVYPGSIERLDFGEAADRKGVCLVTIGQGSTPEERAATWEQVELAARRFVSLQVAVPDEVDPTAYLLEQLGGLKLEGTICRLRFACSDAQYELLDLREVRRALDPAHVVAGIFRERVPEEHRPRVEVTEHHSLAEALERYLDTRPELAELRAEILDAGLALERELALTAAGGAEEEAER